MLKELIDSMKSAAVNRVSSPIFGAYVIAWAAINWKLLVVLLFNDQSIRETLDLVEKKYDDWSMVFLYPAMLAGVYLAVNPWLTFAYYRYSNKMHRKKVLEKLTSEEEIFHKRIKVVQLEVNLERARLDSNSEVALTQRENEFKIEQKRMEYEYELEEKKLRDEVKREEERAKLEEMKLEIQVMAERKKLEIERIRAEREDLPEDAPNLESNNNPSPEARMESFWMWQRGKSAEDHQQLVSPPGESG